jgi:hypothetical protein
MRRRRSEADMILLESENERLRQENAELRETFDHLHKSAQLWVNLYERQLARANELSPHRAKSARRGPQLSAVDEASLPDETA